MSISVEVKNVGPIRTASLTLEPLTVLVGENNTGKTVFATILHRVVAAAPTSDRLRSGRRRQERMPDELRRALEIGVSGQPDLFEATRVADEADPDSYLFNDRTISWAQSFTDDALLDFGQNVLDGLEYAFGSDASDLQRRTSTGRRAPSPRITVRNSSPGWTVTVGLNDGRVDVVGVDAEAWLRGILEQARSGTERNRQVVYELLMGFGLGPVAPGLFDVDWPHRSVHLPAGRTGIMQAYQVLASCLGRQSVSAGVRRIDVPTLPGTAADFLSLLLSLPESRRLRRQRSKQVETIVDRFERKNALSIRLQDDRSTGPSEVVAVTPEGEFPLSRTSSMLSELAPVLLVLRNFTGVGDQLVVDEPEAHLHPWMQRAVAVFLADLAASGVQTVLTTHSDFLLGEINNLIRKGVLNERLAGGDQLDRLLTPSRVHALRFSRDDNGCFAEEIPVDSTDGIDEGTFGEVMESLYEETVRLDREASEATIH